MDNQKFSVYSRLKSFKYAFSGLAVLFKEEHNALIHLVAALVAFVCGLFYSISAVEWIAVIFCIGIVFASEIFNSSIERICNIISPEKSEKIKHIKDLSAAAVLVSAITAFLTGLIIFIPKIF